MTRYKSKTRKPQNPKTPKPHLKNTEINYNLKIIMWSSKKLGSDLLYLSISHGDIHNVIHLIEEDEVDVNSANINGQTALHYAVSSQNLSIVELLLHYGANPNVQDNHEVGFNTPLHIAADLNLIDIMELFLEKSGDPSVKNKCGFTCLHIAARKGYLNMAKLLKSKGVDPNIRDKYGFNAAYWAKEFDYQEILTELGDPLKISKEEFTEFMEQVWADAGVDPGKKKGKKKKGGKKKKK